MDAYKNSFLLSQLLLHTESDDSSQYPRNRGSRVSRLSGDHKRDISSKVVGLLPEMNTLWIY
ncbi:hypothetical protein YC2023_061685 [Brassica napus]